ASFDEPVDTTNSQFTVSDPGGAKLTGTVTRSADQQTLLWTPSAPMAAGTRYTASVRAADTGGNIMAAAVTWSFTVTSTQTCPCSLFSSATVPTVPSADDTGAYEMGVRFTPSVNGQITGVKFYKGTGNTGTHTGTIWSAAGVSLKTGTFTNETASGWQTLTFSTPLAVTAGTTYVASYTVPNGHYSVNHGYFAGYTATSPPLSAPATTEGAFNGLYAVGSGFPTNSYQGNHYWVDVVFTS
ncbi:MAG: DUF4082 domain-containing protein, partial [Saccharothrix sp.]|nr:DUF4082 domain-containing protein [Saccharothrix sp.]